MKVIGQVIRIQNELEINEDDKVAQRTFRGLSVAPAFLTIPANGQAEYFVQIPTALSDNNILTSLLKDDIRLRIQFNKNVSQSAVSNNDIVFLVSNIYQHFIRTDYTQTVNLLKQPFVDYIYVKPQLYQFAINPLVTGNKYTINLTSFHVQSAFLFCYINVQNPTFVTQTVYYPIKDIEIQNSENKNILNNVVMVKPLL